MRHAPNAGIFDRNRHDGYKQVEDFRTAMRRIHSSVLIVTTQATDGPKGMTISAFMSLSMEPPCVAFAVNESAGLHAHIKLGQKFCINVAGADDEAVARVFSGGCDAARRFETGQWTCVGDRAPRLDTAVASIFVEATGISRHGTHSLVIARVAEARLGPHENPLLYGSGRYRSFLIRDSA